MKFKILAKISIFDEIELEILNKTIAPENITMPPESGTVKSEIINNQFVTHIKGEMTIGRLIYTLDDILKASILVKNVAQQTGSDLI